MGGLISYNLRNLVTKNFEGDLNNTPTENGGVRIYILGKCTNTPLNEPGIILIDVKNDDFTRSQLAFKSGRIYTRYSLDFTNWSVWSIVQIQEV